MSNPFIEEDKFQEWFDASQFLLGLKKEAAIDTVSSLEDMHRSINGKANTVQDYIEKEAWKHEVGGALIGGGLGAGAGYLDQVNRGGDSKDKLISAATAGGFGALAGGLLGSTYKNVRKVNNQFSDIAKSRAEIDKSWVDLQQPASSSFKSKLTGAINNVTDSLSDSTESLQAPFRQDNQLYGIRNDFHGALDNNLSGAESLVRRGKLKVKAANMVGDGAGFGRKILNHAKSFAGDVGGGAAFGAGAGVFRASGHPGYEGETGTDVAKRHAGTVASMTGTGALFGGAKKLMQIGLANKTASVRRALGSIGYNALGGALGGGVAGAAANPEDRIGGGARGAGLGAIASGALRAVRVPVNSARFNNLKSNPFNETKNFLLDTADLGLYTAGGLAPIAAGAYRSKEKTAFNLGALKAPLATGVLGAGIGALSADEGHRLEGAAYGGVGGAALGALGRLGMAKKVPGKTTIPAAQPRQLAQTATAPLAQEAQIKQNLNIMPNTPATPNSPIHPMDNRFADIPLKQNNAPVGQYAKEPPLVKPPMDAGWNELASNPLATEVGKDFGPGKDTLSRIYPMNRGGATQAQPIQAQRMRPEALGPVRGAGDDRIFPPEHLKNQALELKGIKLALAIGGGLNMAKSMGAGARKAVGSAMKNPYARNAAVGAGVAGVTGGNPLAGAALGAGGTALNKAMIGMGKNTGMASLVGGAPKTTRMLPAPIQPANAPINLSPGVQLLT